MASALQQWLPGLARLAALEKGLQRDQRLLRLQQQLLQYLGRLSRAAESTSGSAGTAAAAAASRTPAEAAHAALGFELSVGPSTIPGAGRGVFITRGCCPAGGILSLYPGLVYDSRDVEEQQAASALAEDAFAPAPPAWTLDNHYLLALRCLGRSFLIDGRPFGVSAHLWRHAAAGVPVPPNDSWLPQRSAPWLPTAAVVAAEGAQPRAAANARQLCTAHSGQQLQQDGQQQQTGQRQAGQQVAGSSRSAVEQVLMSQAALGNMFNHRPGGATFELVPLPAAAVPPALAHFLPAVHTGGFDPGVYWVPIMLASSPVQAEAGSPAEVWVDYGVDAQHLGYHF